jgi:hypothetical protein
VVTVSLPLTNGRASAAMLRPWEDPLMDESFEPTIAFVPADEASGIEVIVNFGLLTGRAASAAEIDRLAEWLLDAVEAVTIVGEERHDIGSNAEAVVQQVRIEVGEASIPADASERSALQQRIVERAEHWARDCAARH